MCARAPTTNWATAIFTANTTYVPTTTGPYAVVNGITMYQGNVYLSLVDDPSAIDNCGNVVRRVSNNKANILTIASTDLYSNRKPRPGYPHEARAWTVDYADFIEPVPFSAYTGNHWCANNFVYCTIAYANNYRPWIHMPPELARLDPAWANCAINMYGLYDPPIALRSVGALYPSSTLGGGPVSSVNPVPVATKATPGQTGNNGNPAPTQQPHHNPPEHNTPGNPDGNKPPSDNPNPGQGKENPNAAPSVPPADSAVIPDPTRDLEVDPRTTVTPGGPAITRGSTALSLGNDGLMIVAPGTSTWIPFSSSAVPITLGDGTTMTFHPNVGLVLGGKTTVPFPTGGSHSIVTIAGSPFTMSNGALVLSPGTTLTSGDPALTISGTTLSIGPSGLVVIEPTRTVPVQTGGGNYTTATGEMPTRSGSMSKNDMRHILRIWIAMLALFMFLKNWY